MQDNGAATVGAMMPVTDQCILCKSAGIEMTTCLITVNIMAEATTTVTEAMKTMIEAAAEKTTTMVMAIKAETARTKATAAETS
jgi:hypothetical protein